MTQEELDAMMSGDDSLDDLDTEVESKKEYSNHAPKASRENRVVQQLDEVTQESEEKAGKLFENLENISEGMVDSENLIKHMYERLDYFDDIFKRLTDNFPHIKTFKEAHEEIFSFRSGIQQLQSVITETEDETFEAMDTMQFQDIHRQKIERAINVMRSLSRYMNELLAGKVDDDKRVSSAKHIHGDDNVSNDIVSNDDIEALIAQIGGGK